MVKNKIWTVALFGLAVEFSPAVLERLGLHRASMSFTASPSRS